MCACINVYILTGERNGLSVHMAMFVLSAGQGGIKHIVKGLLVLHRTGFYSNCLISGRKYHTYLVIYDIVAMLWDDITVKSK